MQRREFITLIGGAAGAWPLAVRAQQPSVRPLIAMLSPLSAATATRNIAGLRNGLRDLGLVEGRNIFLALRFAGGMAERMPALARELIDLKPDVLIAVPEIQSRSRARPHHHRPDPHHLDARPGPDWDC